MDTSEASSSVNLGLWRGREGEREKVSLLESLPGRRRRMSISHLFEIVLAPKQTRATSTCICDDTLGGGGGGAAAAAARKDEWGGGSFAAA
jgi:hypothetical protein